MILLISVIFRSKRRKCTIFGEKWDKSWIWSAFQSNRHKKLTKMRFFECKRLSVQQGEGRQLRQARTLHATVARQLPPVARQCPTVARQLPDSCPTVARQLTDSCPTASTVARQLPDKCTKIFGKSGSKTAFRSNFLERPQIFRNAADFRKLEVPKRHPPKGHPQNLLEFYLNFLF